MARAPDERIEQAKAMYLKGMKLVDIAGKLKVPEGTVRRWKCTHNWEGERSGKKSERSQNKKIKQKEAIVEEVEQIMENSELTDKQRLFCCFYIKTFNASKSYQKAYGVDYPTAMSCGSRLLKNDKVKEEINKLNQGRMNREMLSEDDIFQKYMDIAFADITDYVEFGREEVQVMNMFGPVEVKDPKTGEKVPLTKTVNTIRFRESGNVDGTIISEVKQGKDGASIKLADRMKALQWLSDHMDFATKEQQARIALLKAQTERMALDPMGEDEDGVEIINDAPKGTSEDIGNYHPEVSSAF